VKEALIDGPAVQAGLSVPPARVSRLDMAWRALATGFCFAVFGLGQLVLGLTVFPLVMALVWKPSLRRQVAKRAIHLSFKAFVELMRLTRVLDYRCSHLERLDRPGLLVVANHPSLIDVVFLISFLPQADCVVKGSLFKNLFIRFAVKGAGYISNDDDPEAVVKACGDSFAEGNSLVVFPEGTRSVPGQPFSLQRGLAQIAVRTQRDMTPVIIRAKEHNLGKNSRWWKVPPRRMDFEFQVNEDLPIAPFLGDGASPALAAREVTEFLTRYFAKETAAHG
jgi:1-acyl-sn-glycerol-3-phosphate acyltransferase